MASVILVGAGATLAEALPGNPNRAHRPPLDRTFFEMCGHARLPELPTVVSYMYDVYGIDPVDSASGMEEVFNYVYADAIGPNATDAAVDAYWALIKMYARAITDTTRQLKGTSRKGIGAVIRYLWRSGERELTIVTFNQDLVIENAIEEATKRNVYSEIPWSIDHCYETTFTNQWGQANASMFTTGVADSVRVLKLHGSLNWVNRVRSVNDARNSLREPSGTSGLLMQRRLSRDLQARDNGRIVHLVPLIVPPVFEKSHQLRSQLDSVWIAAENALSECARLIVFGYSFPPADFGAAALLRRAFVSNTMLNTIEAINPDASVVGRIGAITRAPSIKSYADVSAFTAAEH